MNTVSKIPTIPQLPRFPPQGQCVLKLYGYIYCVSSVTRARRKQYLHHTIVVPCNPQQTIPPAFALHKPPPFAQGGQWCSHSLHFQRECRGDHWSPAADKDRICLATRECKLSRQSVTVTAQKNRPPLFVANCPPRRVAEVSSSPAALAAHFVEIIKWINSLFRKNRRLSYCFRTQCKRHAPQFINTSSVRLRLTASPHAPQGEANAVAITMLCLFIISNSHYFRPCGRAMLAPTMLP